GPAAAGPPFRRAHGRALAGQGAVDQRWARPPGGRADILAPDSTHPTGETGSGLMSGPAGGMRSAPIPDAASRTTYGSTARALSASSVAITVFPPVTVV